MSFDLQKILESKRALRRNLAARPVAEKLRMLNALRERELAIRAVRLNRIRALSAKNPRPTAQADGGTSI